jgi:hypothetical protein
MMKHVTEAQAWKEHHARKGVHRPPLKSLKEIGNELGVSHMVFIPKLGMEGAPKPVLNRKNGLKFSYYEPKQFKEWWEKVKDGK